MEGWGLPRMPCREGPGAPCLAARSCPQKRWEQGPHPPACASPCPLTFFKIFTCTALHTQASEGAATSYVPSRLGQFTGCIRLLCMEGYRLSKSVF